MTPDVSRHAPLPASIVQRVVARSLDLLGIVMTFFVAFMLCAAPVAAWAVLNSVSASSAHDLDIGLDLLMLAIVVAAFVAVIFEPLRQSSRHSTYGRSRAGIVLVRHERPSRTASTGRVMGRWAISIAACGGAAYGSFAVAAAAGAEMRPEVVSALIVLPPLVVWLSALLTAAVRADRRGWHDLAARTMLVTASSYADMRASADNLAHLR